MSTQNDNITAARAAVRTALAGLAARHQALIDKINSTEGEGLTGEQTEFVLADLLDLKNAIDTVTNSETPPPIPPEGGAMPGPFAGDASNEPMEPGTPRRQFNR